MTGCETQENKRIDVHVGRRKARESLRCSPFRLDLDLNKHMCLDICTAHAKKKINGKVHVHIHNLLFP